MPDGDVVHKEPSAFGDLAVGTLLDDRYLILDLIGRGGMASVYRADDQMLGRPVAIKLFQVGVGAPRDLQRELGEIRTLASLNHHGLVTLFDATVTNTATSEHAYLVMEFVDGPTLRGRLERGPLQPDAVAAMAVDLAEALHVVHGLGVVHRDIKPDNVLLSPSPTPDREFRAKLADFGIALLADSARLTQPGTVMGTAAYLSPEQAKGEAPDTSSDVYSLGLVLLESFTRVRAFPGSVIESITAKLSAEPNIPDELGDEWKSLLRAMTARDPVARPSAWEVAETARALDVLPAQTEALAAATSLSGETQVMDAPVMETQVMDSPTLRLPVGTGPTMSYQPTVALQPTLSLQPTASLQPTLSLQFTGETAAFESPAIVHEGLARSTGAPWRKRWWFAVASILVAGIIVAVLVVNQPQAPAPTPTIPAVSGQLGEHLKQLLESVTP